MSARKLSMVSNSTLRGGCGASATVPALALAAGRAGTEAAGLGTEESAGAGGSSLSLQAANTPVVNARPVMQPRSTGKPEKRAARDRRRLIFLGMVTDKVGLPEQDSVRRGERTVENSLGFGRQIDHRGSTAGFVLEVAKSKAGFQSCNTKSDTPNLSGGIRALRNRHGACTL